MTASPLLTVVEASHELRISRWTINRLIQSQQLRSIKIGRRRLVPRQAIDEFIAHYNLEHAS